MPDVANADFSTIRPESRAGLGTDAFNRELARATPTPPGRASERMLIRGVEIHTDGSNPSLSESLIFPDSLGADFWYAGDSFYRITAARMDDGARASEARFVGYLRLITIEVAANPKTKPTVLVCFRGRSFNVPAQLDVRSWQTW